MILPTPEIVECTSILKGMIFNKNQRGEHIYCTYIKEHCIGISQGARALAVMVHSI